MMDPIIKKEQNIKLLVETFIVPALSKSILLELNKRIETEFLFHPKELISSLYRSEVFAFPRFDTDTRVNYKLSLFYDIRCRLDVSCIHLLEDWLKLLLTEQYAEIKLKGGRLVCNIYGKI